MKYFAMVLLLLLVSVIFLPVSSVYASKDTTITVQFLDEKFAAELAETEKKITVLEVELFQLYVEADKETRKPLIKAWEELTANRDHYHTWEKLSVKHKEAYLAEAEKRTMNRLIRTFFPMELWPESLEE